MVRGSTGNQCSQSRVREGKGRYQGTALEMFHVYLLAHFCFRQCAGVLSKTRSPPIFFFFLRLGFYVFQAGLELLSLALLESSLQYHPSLKEAKACAHSPVLGSVANPHSGHSGDSSELYLRLGCDENQVLTAYGSNNTAISLPDLREMTANPPHQG